MFSSFLGRPDESQSSIIEQLGPVTVLFVIGHRVRYEQNCSARVAKYIQPRITPLAEEDIAHRQCLIYHHDGCVDVRLYRECQPDEHATGVGLARLVDEIADIREFHDLVETGCNFPLREPKDAAIQEHIFPAREIGIESGTKVQQSSNTPADLDIAAAGGEGTANHLQQC